MRGIDLRSDTVTRPTAAMRRAMADAEVGDDVLGEDPTVRRLELLAAERLGKEAALLVSSGTQGNLVALLVHCGRGEEVILGDESHTFVYEAGGSAAVGGIHPHPIPTGPDGTLAPERIQAAVRADNLHFPRTRLICLENSHNRRGGTVLHPTYMRRVREVADQHRLAVHVDGARLFNAAVALGLPVAQLAEDADTVSVCLSKGLCAPIGSLLCGSEDFVREARRARKMLGGGMRQAGVIAAAGIVALETMVDRLAEDHARAHRLAEGLAEMPGIRICPEDVRTNIVNFELHRPDMSPSALTSRAAALGLLFFPIGGARLRLVTHHDVDDTQIDAALLILQRLLGSAPARSSGN
ncbi:MAG: low-specificity L-threonine aldolase [Ardenticatenia bacterium]|nr:low-specificity L-threonine aldolase [Ardenticatenia bacterium]